MRVPLIGPSNESQSPDADVRRSMNWYPEPADVANGKTTMMLYPSPGYLVWASLPQVNVRALFFTDGRLFAVAGTGFYEIDSLGGVDLRGLLTDSTDPASISTNGDGGGEVFVTSGGDGYIFTLATNVFAQVLTGTADVGDFIDGYFVALDATTSELQVSDLFDGMTWDPLMKTQRSTASDPWVGMTVSDRQIHLFGTLTTETWYNSGNPDFPFAPVQGSLIRDGIAAPYSTVALIDNTRIWLSANSEGTGVVKRASGFQPTRISTHAVEHAIQSYRITSDAISWAYQEDGHTFYLLSFPTGRATWVYDATTQLWHERGWWNALDMRFDTIRGRCHAFAFGKHLVGDRLTGGLYEQAVSLYKDVADTETRRLLQGPHLSSGGAWLSFADVQLIMECGVGTTAFPDPQVILQWSDDGGHTWGNEHWVSAGKMGEYGWGVVWRRLGRSRDRVFRIVVSDGVPWRLLDMHVRFGQS